MFAISTPAAGLLQSFNLSQIVTQYYVFAMEFLEYAETKYGKSYINAIISRFY